MTPSPLRPLLTLIAVLIPALLPAQRLWVGMPVTAIAPDSQLGEGLPPDLDRENLYLVEFDQTRFADPATESGRLNLQLLLRQWDQFRTAPPRGIIRLVFLQFQEPLPVIHRVELAGWDGRLEIDTTPRPFQLTADPEVRHHNAFIYLKTARQAQDEGETGKARAYLTRVPILDPNGAEAPQARELLAGIEAEERRQAQESLLARADVERGAGRLEEAIALYQEALDRYGSEDRTARALAAAQADLPARRHAAEEARRQAQARRLQEEEQAREARAEARVEAEAQRQTEVRAELEDREREVQVLLNRARILREQGKLQEAVEALQIARNLDNNNPQVEAEARQLSAAVARQKLLEAGQAGRAGRKGDALRLLREAAEWDPRNEAVEAEIANLRGAIAPGEVDSMALARLLWDPDEDMQFVFTPPASPQSHAGRVFLWNGVLVQEIEGSHLVKVGSRYKFCFVADFPLDGINYNTGVRVVGEYIGNITFTTVLGAPVQVPCLRALYAE
jgi:tetratricopeptide (TPR) repeat protein